MTIYAKSGSLLREHATLWCSSCGATWIPLTLYWVKFDDGACKRTLVSSLFQAIIRRACDRDGGSVGHGDCEKTATRNLLVNSEIVCVPFISLIPHESYFIGWVIWRLRDSVTWVLNIWSWNAPNVPPFKSNNQRRPANGSVKCVLSNNLSNAQVYTWNTLLTNL